MINANHIIYLSGAMSLYKNSDWGFGRFNAAASQLRALGFRVINPAENFNGDTSLSYETYLKHDIKQLMDCTAIVTLDNWRLSNGARREVEVAGWVKIPHYEFEDIIEVTK